MSWSIDKLPYRTDAFEWFMRLRSFSWPMILESRGYSEQRYDIVTAQPAVTIRTMDGATTVHRDGKTLPSTLDPFDCVEEEVVRRRPASPCPLDAGFGGGAIGYFGYELGHHVERLPTPRPNDAGIPDMMVGIYDWFILIDHKAQQTLLLCSPNVSPADYRLILAAAGSPSPCALKEFRAGYVSSNLSQQEYNGAIGKIISYIHAGDCYQVNLAQRFDTGFEGDPLHLYQQMRQRHRAPFSACLAFPELQVLSYSPERFLKVTDGNVTTEPIKGTRPRGRTPAEDEEYAGSLRRSDKDRAENLMIVDLLRNDLGRCCVPGSIGVDRLFELRSFPNVHHLVSTVHGRLRQDATAMTLLKACFPGGSITGAPKIRAMEIINELEPDRRHVYCGAIGYFDYRGNMDTNLAIRTVLCTRGRILFWGGGGIVADSTAPAEYQESLAKVSMIRESLALSSGRKTTAVRHSHWSRGTAETPR